MVVQEDRDVMEFDFLSGDRKLSNGSVELECQGGERIGSIGQEGGVVASAKLPITGSYLS